MWKPSSRERLGRYCVLSNPLSSIRKQHGSLPEPAETIILRDWQPVAPLAPVPSAENAALPDDVRIEVLRQIRRNAIEEGVHFAIAADAGRQSLDHALGQVVGLLPLIPPHSACQPARSPSSSRPGSTPSAIARDRPSGALRSARHGLGLVTHSLNCRDRLLATIG